ncbi:Sporulation related domain-containing protein [Roseivivax lentus]|uniref:Sporulation related domain-containing protein n=1 Tax=Roseivivax lentus TaxID=633194 RepID=A0A1N7MNM4_9RHOB|nr:SPOR domain-containing protein [Roseivivax lentus]SIS87745.1 Sporulation related domain-containing protein [Roseivivax lentus]
MADIYRSGPVAGSAGQSTFATLTHLTGAALSLALIVGIGVWGTKLILRDVSGIPVVRATEGPMRVQPDDPGGRLADHQGLAVNDVAGQGMAAPPPSEIRLAPRDAALSAEDVPLGALGARPRSRQAALPESPTLGEEAPEALEAQEVPLPEGEMAETGAPDAALEDAAEPEEFASATIGITDDPVRAAIDATVEMALEADGGIARSLRPQTRPAGLRDTARSAAAAATPAGAKEVDPTSLPAGTRLVQLGAYDSVETARREWSRFETRFEDYLSGKDRVIEQAASGGKTFYRLRAHGFADLSDARRFCAALVAENADCIPVVTR